MLTQAEHADLAAGIDASKLEPKSRSLTAVACPWCGATAGEPCRTPKGAVANLHRWRMDSWRSRMRQDPFLVRVRETNERLGVREGEIYLAQTYWLDPGAKCSLLARVPDGHDPECNQYWSDVDWLGFLGDLAAR